MSFVFGQYNWGEDECRYDEDVGVGWGQEGEAGVGVLEYWEGVDKDGGSDCAVEFWEQFGWGIEHWVVIEEDKDFAFEREWY